MKRRITRLGLVGLASLAVLAVAASPAAAKSKTKTFNRCFDTAVSIPDQNDAAPAPSSSVSIQVAVPKFKGKPQNGVVKSFDGVDLRITHTFDGDLVALLVSPAGHVVNLAERRGDQGDGYGSGSQSCAGSPVLFTDSAAASITNPGNTGENPIVGSFRPEQPLASFVGGPAKGFWTLIVTDAANQDVGVINAVSLHFTYKYKVKPKK